MAYRFGNRDQYSLLPAGIEDYVSPDAPVRAYDAFVDALDLKTLGIEFDTNKVGNSSYDPRTMLKLLVYGYSYGVRSSRKLERETHYNLSFIWLTGGLKPDHKTIAEFRRNNKTALGRILKQCARLCVKLDLIAGNTLFIDGSKVRANASLNQHWSEARCRKRLAKIDRRIEEILTECDRIDDHESCSGSLVRMKKELTDQETLKSRVKGILDELQVSEKATLNTTDPDSVRIHGRQGSHAGYNMQTVVDEKHGLIVHADVVSENNDLGQFVNQTKQAHETLGRPSQTVCADAGYCNYDKLEELDDGKIQIIVPSKRQSSKKKAKPFDKSEFRYDHARDVYICPAGEMMKFRHIDNRGRRIYRAGALVCRECIHFGKCTRSRKHGRKIVRYLNEGFRERLQQEYAQPKSQDVYKLRKQKVELPFGHIKRNLNSGYFLLRGLDGVRAEASLLANCFNIARLITLIGVPSLVAMLAN